MNLDFDRILGFLCLNSSGVGTPHSKQMPGHYNNSFHTLRIHGLLNRELWLACKELFLYEYMSTIAALQNTKKLFSSSSKSETIYAATDLLSRV